MDVTVGHEHSHAVNRKVTEAQILERLAEYAKHQPRERGQFVACSKFNKVIPWLFMAMPRLAGLKPCLASHVKALYPAPIQESSRIEKDDQGSSDANNHEKIDIAPRLPRRLRMRKASEQVGDYQHGNCHDRAEHMDDISLLRKN